jgi:6-phosphogluconolactonase
VTISPAAPTVVVVPDAGAVSRAAAGRIAAALTSAVGRRGRADLAATGGSTAAGIYGYLGSEPLRSAVPWEAVHIWWGDDRFVPRDHPLSNVLPADQILLGAAAFAGQSGTGTSGIDVELGAQEGAPIPIGNLHPFPCTRAIGEELGPAWCASTYAEEVRATVPTTGDGWPIFDLVLLGIGPDGHILSVFPGSAALDSSELGLAVPAPTHVEPHVARVTLNPAIVTAAREVLAITAGAPKAAILGRIFSGHLDPHALPAQLALRPGATWLLDAAAAAELPAGTARSW